MIPSHSLTAILHEEVRATPTLFQGAVDNAMRARKSEVKSEVRLLRLAHFARWRQLSETEGDDEAMDMPCWGSARGGTLLGRWL